MMSLINNALISTVGAGKNIYEKVVETESFKVLEQKALETAHMVGEGIIKGAQIGVEKLECSGKSFGQIGFNFLRDGALNAFDTMTYAAAGSYERIRMDERTRRVKEESMNFLNSLEMRALKRISFDSNVAAFSDKPPC